MKRKRRLWTGAIYLAWGWSCQVGSAWEVEILSLKAQGHDSRIDLIWEQPQHPKVAGYHVERAASSRGPFKRLNTRLHEPMVYSDFLGTNNRTCFYRVSALDSKQTVLATSAVARAKSKYMTQEELLSSVQEATFRYFWRRRQSVIMGHGRIGCMEGLAEPYLFHDMTTEGIWWKHRIWCKGY